MKFGNLETQMMAKWHESKIEEIIEKYKGKSNTELICLLSEELEEVIKEQLLELPEGYISELVGASFNSIDYPALLAYFKKS